MHLEYQSQHTKPQLIEIPYEDGGDLRRATRRATVDEGRALATATLYLSPLDLELVLDLDTGYAHYHNRVAIGVDAEAALAALAEYLGVGAAKFYPAAQT